MAHFLGGQSAITNHGAHVIAANLRFLGPPALLTADSDALVVHAFDGTTWYATIRLDFSDDQKIRSITAIVDPFKESSGGRP